VSYTIINYSCVFTNQADFESIRHDVIDIQQSIGWNEEDLHFAKLRLNNEDSPKVLVKIAETSKLIGYATLVTKPGHSWYLSQIAVHIDYQGNGIGKAIMTEIFAKAVLINIKNIYLETEGDNEKLMKFYKSFPNRLPSQITPDGYTHQGHPKVWIYYTIC